MRKVERKIHFFRVGLYVVAGGALVPVSDYNNTVSRVLNAINRLGFQGQPNRYLDLGGANRLFLCIDSNSNQIYYGKAVMARRELLPDLERSGNLSPLHIPVDSGLAEITHFVLFANYRVVGVEYNFYGPRASSLASYLEHKSQGLIHRVLMRPILNLDVEETLNRIGEVSVVEVEVHRNGINVLEELDQSLAAAFRAVASVSEAETLDLVLRKRKYSRTGFSFPFSRERLLNLLRRPDPEMRESISKMKARARDTLDGNIREFDLLQDKFVFAKQVVRVDNRRRAIDSGSMYAAIEEAFQELRPNLVPEAIRDDNQFENVE